MRTRDDCTVLVLGDAPWRQSDCTAQPLTDDMRVLLWVIDGAERRQKLAAKWSGQAAGSNVAVRSRRRA